VQVDSQVAQLREVCDDEYVIDAVRQNIVAGTERVHMDEYSYQRLCELMAADSSGGDQDNTAVSVASEASWAHW
jgi:hypothetical protein